MQQETDDQTGFSTPEIHASKRRKTRERIVVAVKVQESDKNTRKHHKSELGTPPSDCWSWRKYGQKPIKGSPYPRGYYRCSASKGCSAKKQVERCKTDASVFIITYKSSHNHPGPDHDLAFPLRGQKQQDQNDNLVPLIHPDPPHTITTPKQEQKTVENKPHDDEDHSHYSQSQSSASTPDDDVVVDVSEQDHHHNPLAEKLKTASVLYNEGASSKPSSCDLTTLENDFYDELEELPTSSFFTAFMSRSFCGEERVLVNP